MPIRLTLVLVHGMTAPSGQLKQVMAVLWHALAHDIRVTMDSSEEVSLRPARNACTACPRACAGRCALNCIGM
eukprot:5460320-Amphidinium_carterae.1